MTPSPDLKKRVGVLTSGGDAQGMNAAVRAVVRTSLEMGATPYAILEGWQGAVEGGERIKEMAWSDVSSILNEGGTVIGTARSPEFYEYEGRRRACKNLLERGIDRLVVIGGDGSLTGTNEFRKEWPGHVQGLLEAGEITPEVASAHPALMIVGIVGSIDNDMVGTDMTIGTDSALNRIVEAIDDISSTAASHQRMFVIEVMGRHCGYLPLMSAVAGGADYVFTPENPPTPGWEEDMSEKLRLGREAGRRESIVIVAEGAKDSEGNRITSAQVAEAIEARLGEKPRITILGHVQRGGTPSAYDRWMPTLMGYGAAQEILKATADTPANVIGVRKNRLTRIPLVESVEATRNVAELVANKEFDKAIESRGASFVKMTRINQILSEPPGNTAIPEGAKRVAVMHMGGLAPGMNTAARAAVRIGLDKGMQILGVQGSMAGLMNGDVRELTWSDVEGWAFKGGAELGTRRTMPTVDQYYAIGRAIEEHKIDALLLIGGMNAYLSIYDMFQERGRYPAFNIPMVLVPATIDNNLPGAELSIGADTAVNNAVWALDRIKESAAASRRCFVAETMGRKCGYLALMAAIASGAEKVYLNEEPTTLADISKDVAYLKQSFRAGRRLFLVVRNEEAHPEYNREFLARVFESEGEGLYDVRHSALGHLQQGGAPSPFDRLLATRLVYEAIEVLDEIFARGDDDACYIGEAGGKMQAFPVRRMMDHLDTKNRRPFEQWWLSIATVIPVVSMPRGDVIPVEIPIEDADHVVTY
ncbi:6-phosphofructokinase [Gleimia europaea]|nr:6-phosphofructokinase [Gleimia europaea]MDK8534224.1 6-phosphofructokinase [Gleimia europaea]